MPNNDHDSRVHAHAHVHPDWPGSHTDDHEHIHGPGRDHHNPDQHPDQHPDQRPPTPEQAAAAARAFTERARAANRARLVNTLTQVDAQAGAELREYLADVEPTVPLSELLALTTEWRKWEADSLAMSRAEARSDTLSNRLAGMSTAYGALAKELERLILRYERAR
jgi:hypothetical protein